MNYRIPFNKPFLTGKETTYIEQAVLSGKLSGNGMFTKKCHDFFKENFEFQNCLLTTSCTDALEMAAILLNIEKGDEVIIPSYTFVSTANAFVLRGAKIIFADSGNDNPNMNAESLSSLITSKTKAIVVVHYAGIACDMDPIMDLATKNNIAVVEDAAQAIDSFYKGRPLGSIGHLSAFSFHETKNIISGEGGMLVINDESLVKRAEIIWEKGTNRSAFFRGETDKYSWVDIGSSFLPSEVIAAFLFAQLEKLKEIQERRKLIWNTYFKELKTLESKQVISLPKISDFATNNGHMFYILCKSQNERDELIAFMKKKGILLVFHYLSLHKSTFFKNYQPNNLNLPCSDEYSEKLLRLPLFYNLTNEEQKEIIEGIKEFYKF